MARLNEQQQSGSLQQSKTCIFYLHPVLTDALLTTCNMDCTVRIVENLMEVPMRNTAGHQVVLKKTGGMPFA
jgi:hypothetical protein